MNAPLDRNAIIKNDLDGKSSVHTRRFRKPEIDGSSHSSSLVVRESPDTFTPRFTARELQKMQRKLGKGPMRFAPTNPERSLREQMQSLTDDQLECVRQLREKWEFNHPDAPFPDEMYLRFARCSPGDEPFNVKASWKQMKHYDKRYSTITAAEMESQLMTKTLFPVPGLKTLDGGLDVFYMRPCRYFAKTTPLTAVLDNLVYCMNTMCEKESACSQGIGFVALMNDWDMSNFSSDYCFQFMQILQGRLPVRVRLFLIVNPPKWFNSVWKVMKPMLSASFREKVHMISDTDLPKYLQADYLQYMPDDAPGGQVDTVQLVKDYIIYRTFVESAAVTKNDLTNQNKTMAMYKTMMMSSKSLGNDHQQTKERGFRMPWMKFRKQESFRMSR